MQIPCMRDIILILMLSLASSAALNVNDLLDMLLGDTRTENDCITLARIFMAVDYLVTSPSLYCT